MTKKLWTETLSNTTSQMLAVIFGENVYLLHRNDVTHSHASLVHKSLWF